MAAFRAHLSAGLVVGYLAGVASVIIQWATAPFTALLVFFATCVGSLLPDLDSDHSTPFSITFGMLSVLAGSFAFAYCMQQPHSETWILWFGIPPVVALLVRYGVGLIFQTFTVHRGIFHSLPMAIIVTGGTAVALKPFNLPLTDLLAISLGVGMGFLAHLVLDEVCAAVNFDGLRIETKKSFGTALTLTSPSLVATVSAYLVLGTLVVLNWPLIQQGFSIMRAH